MEQELHSLGETLVHCSLNCSGIVNKPEEGIIPRYFVVEKREGKNRCIVVGLNPGKCKKKEKEFFLREGISYKTLEKGLENHKNGPYFKRARDLITSFGYDGDILWTNLAKCECSGRNGDIPVQTLRICINRFLRKEIQIFKAPVIFCLGDVAFNFCALSFPNHFVIGLPHTTGSYGKAGFLSIKKKIDANMEHYKKILANDKDENGTHIAVKISTI